MAIQSINQYQYQNPYQYNFGSLTYGANRKPIEQNYHQASAGMPSTLPTVVGIPQTTDMELASKIAQSNIGIINPIEATNSKQGVGFIPSGDGEYHPAFDPEAHKLEYFC